MKALAKRLILLTVLAAVVLSVALIPSYRAAGLPARLAASGSPAVPVVHETGSAVVPQLPVVASRPPPKALDANAEARVVVTTTVAVRAVPPVPASKHVTVSVSHVTVVAVPAAAGGCYGVTNPYALLVIGRESHCDPYAVNRSSGACGIGQADPCSKMGCKLGDGPCQVAWMTAYVIGRYGSWAAAWAHEVTYGSY